MAVSLSAVMISSCVTATDSLEAVDHVPALPEQ